MAVNMFELLSNGIKIAFFFQKHYKKSPSGPQTPIASGDWELRPQIPVCDALVLHYFTQHISRFKRFCFSTFGSRPLPLAKSWLRAKHQAPLVDLLFYDIFAPQKLLLSKFSDDVISCGFGPPLQSKILATPMLQLHPKFGAPASYGELGRGIGGQVNAKR